MNWKFSSRSSKFKETHYTRKILVVTWQNDNFLASNGKTFHNSDKAIRVMIELTTLLK